jgi:adenylate cyclase
MHTSLSDDAIRTQLERLLISPELKDKPMLRDFLRFIVERTLAGYAHEIKGYTVATQALGREENFDPLTDPIVRIQAGRLRRALERYYHTQGRLDPVRIGIPLGSYVPIFHPLSNEEQGQLESAPPQQDVLLAMPEGPSVAVTPLLNLTGDPGQEYFADGLTEELTNELARYQDLRVISCRSAMQRKGADADVMELARGLGVRFLLEGNVRKEADSIKIGVRLIDTTTRVQLWGEQYRRELRADSLIALQEEISQRVAARIGSEYGIIPQTLSRESRKKPPETLAIYESFLMFYHYVSVLTPEAFDETLRALERAVASDPECGIAWSLVAILYCHNHSLHFSPMETPLEKALVFARKGVSLEPQTQLVRAALTAVYFLCNERNSFLVEVEKALALNPNAPAIVGFLGWLMALYGEWERGLAILEKGMELNPLYPGWFHMAPYLHSYHQGRYEEAYHQAQQFRMPQLFWDPLLRAAALGQLARTKEAGAAVAELLQLRPDFPTKGPWLIGCYVKFERLAKALLDGLQKAGLHL